MKKKFGSRICIYTILVGNDPNGKTLLAQIASSSRCGLSKTADDISNAVDMADFVRSVFLIPKDRDKDGVFDYLDECLGTPEGIEVDTKGCPIDSDGDGVVDTKDRCPKTPKGVNVNQFGCWQLEGILFDTGKWNIKSQNYPKIDNIVKILKLNSSINVEIRGYTDNHGGEAYNRNLSKKRANEIRNYLMSKNIAGSRLKAKGFGSGNPVASNNTSSGRQKNRRIEVKIIH